MITNLETLAAMAGAQEVALSGWNGEEIRVRLKKPSLYAMAAEGRIPNPLLGVAEGLFMGNQDAIKRASLDDTAKRCE